MDSQTSSHSAELAPIQCPAFQDWKECNSALKGISTPDTPERHAAFVERISASSQKHHIAFEILCAILDSKDGPRLRWLEKPMLRILSEDDTLENAPVFNSPSGAGEWVTNELQDVRNSSLWEQFVASGKLFWVMYVVLSTSTDKTAYIEALTAFSECAERCHNRKKQRIQASDVKWITSLLKSKIGKAGLSKTFLNTLFAINATASLSGELRSDFDWMQTRIKDLQDKLTAAVHEKEIAEHHSNDLQVKLEATCRSLEDTKKELIEEKLHTTRLGGFSVTAKQQTINHVISVVRQGANHRLEHIRAYADRENPNKEEILALVGEIEKHLSEIEEDVGE